MSRKRTALVAAMTAAALAACGLARVGDDDSPLHKIMEQVQKGNSAIVRGVRNAAMYKKSRENVAKAAAELVRLGKEARPLGEDQVKTQKKTIDEWNKLLDAYVKEAEGFSALVSEKDTTQAQAKDAYKVVSKSCTACHDVFRVEDDSSL